MGVVFIIADNSVLIRGKAPGTGTVVTVVDAEIPQITLRESYLIATCVNGKLPVEKSGMGYGISGSICSVTIIDSSYADCIAGGGKGGNGSRSGAFYGTVISRDSAVTTVVSERKGSA